MTTTPATTTTPAQTSSKYLDKVYQLVTIDELLPFEDCIAKELCRQMSNTVYSLCTYDDATIETESDSIDEIVQILNEPKATIIEYINILRSHDLEICANKGYGPPSSSWGEHPSPLTPY